MREAIASAPGKVNLRLEVGSKRPDGYHGLLSVFESLSLREYVQVRTKRETGITVKTTVYTQGSDEQWRVDKAGTADLSRLDKKDHLAYKAARLLQPLAVSWGSTAAGLQIHVHKCVPVAGGMAGGSADAAATLVALNELWSLGLTEEQLLALGTRLGADVPACILGGISVGHDRGDKVRAVQVGSELTHRWVLALANEGLSTPEVFRRFDQMNYVEGEPGQVLAQEVLDCLISKEPVLGLRNDLTKAALDLRPDLEPVMQEVTAVGATPILSGSGPTVAAFCPDIEIAKAVQDRWASLSQVRQAVMSVGPSDPAQLEKKLAHFMVPVFV